MSFAIYHQTMQWSINACNTARANINDKTHYLLGKAAKLAQPLLTRSPGGVFDCFIDSIRFEDLHPSDYSPVSVDRNQTPLEETGSSSETAETSSAHASIQEHADSDGLNDARNFLTDGRLSEDNDIVYSHVDTRDHLLDEEFDRKRERNAPVLSTPFQLGEVQGEEVQKAAPSSCVAHQYCLQDDIRSDEVSQDVWRSDSSSLLATKQESASEENDSDSMSSWSSDEDVSEHSQEPLDGAGHTCLCPSPETLDRTLCARDLIKPSERDGQRRRDQLFHQCKFLQPRLQAAVALSEEDNAMEPVLSSPEMSSSEATWHYPTRCLTDGLVSKHDDVVHSQVVDMRGHLLDEEVDRQRYRVVPVPSIHFESGEVQGEEEQQTMQSSARRKRYSPANNVEVDHDQPPVKRRQIADGDKTSKIAGYDEDVSHDVRRQKASVRFPPDRINEPSDVDAVDGIQGPYPKRQRLR